METILKNARRFRRDKRWETLPNEYKKLEDQLYAWFAYIPEHEKRRWIAFRVLRRFLNREQLAGVVDHLASSYFTHYNNESVTCEALGSGKILARCGFETEDERKLIRKVYMLAALILWKFPDIRNEMLPIYLAKLD